MSFKRFEDILAWQRARQMVKLLYDATRGPEFSKDYPLKDQMRRAGVSVMLNIAEGAARHTDKDFAHFLVMARGSAAEVQSAAYVALDQGYLGKGEFEQIYGLAEECSKMTNALTAHLRAGN